MSLFGVLGQPQLPKPVLPEADELPVLETLQQEFEMLGFYLSSHPLNGYRPSLQRLGVIPSDQLPACAGQRVRLAGVVIGKQERTTARSRFAFVQLSDPAGIYEITMFAELLGRARDLLDARRPLLIEGEVRVEDGDVVKVLASSVEALDERLANRRGAAASRIEIRLRHAAAVPALHDILGPPGSGGVRVRLVVPLEDGEEVSIELPDESRLAFSRRIDVERSADVLAVVDL